MAAFCTFHLFKSESVTLLRVWNGFFFFFPVGSRDKLRPVSRSVLPYVAHLTLSGTKGIFPVAFGYLEDLLYVSRRLITATSCFRATTMQSNYQRKFHCYNTRNREHTSCTPVPFVASHWMFQKQTWKVFIFRVGKQTVCVGCCLK